MQTNLKEALKSADTYKVTFRRRSLLLNEFCGISLRSQCLHPEGNKVKFTWREYVQLAQIIWDKVKETSRECAGKEIEVKVPAKFGLISAAFALIGFKL
jgi:hypothetical protein